MAAGSLARVMCGRPVLVVPDPGRVGALCVAGDMSARPQPTSHFEDNPKASAGSRVRPSRERPRTYANSPTIIEPHAHPVHPPTILPAGSDRANWAIRRCDDRVPLGQAIITRC
jgi:hypothetical protein